MRRFFYTPNKSPNPAMLSIGALIIYTVLVGLVYVSNSSVLKTTDFMASLSEEIIIARVNPHRLTINTPSLRQNPLLAEAAKLKAKDMISNNYFSHVSPSGDIPWVWFDRVGYNFIAAGENLAIDFADPDLLVTAWLNSPSHAANINNGMFQDIGIGIENGNIDGRKTTVVVMFLGKRANILATPKSAATEHALGKSSGPTSRKEDTSSVGVNQALDPVAIQERLDIEDSEKFAFLKLSKSTPPQEPLIMNTESVEGLTTTSNIEDIASAPRINLIRTLDKASSTLRFIVTFLFAVVILISIFRIRDTKYSLGHVYSRIAVVVILAAINTFS